MWTSDAAAGGSDDYAKGGAGIKYAYTLELRDTGRYGFVLPESLIGDTAQEFFSGFIAFYNHIKSKWCSRHRQVLTTFE